MDYWQLNDDSLLIFELHRELVLIHHMHLAMDSLSETQQFIVIVCGGDIRYWQWK